MFKRIVFFIFIGIFVSSCKYLSLKDEENREFVAKVHNKLLYKDQLVEDLPANLSKEDSIIFVNSYINEWAKKQLLLRKAETNLEEETSKYNRLVQEYREDLFINSYKKAVVEQELDTIVTEAQIDSYYQENNKNFKLNEALVKLKFLSFGNNVINKDELMTLFKSEKKSDLDSLVTKKLEFNNFYLNDSAWVKMSDVYKKIPFLKEMNVKEDLIKKEKLIQKEDSLVTNLVYIKDVLERNNTAPISYIKPTVRQIILQKRKLELLKEIEETLFDDARKNKQFEIYTQKNE
ncbi:hypothetical protein [Aureivirga sp. CE67]|uniref:hypothetical protein n=1 Tax=Aureivirga sp. CE67 TaxID=1788983 RepID=UPI001E60DAD2|nr:hypothetical protein [Aureivirga sp. CE67]